MKQILAIVLLLLIPSIASALWTEKYVTDSAAGGNGDIATPWTLAEAFTAANTTAGMRINIKAGNYAPGAALTFSDTDATGPLPIWYRGYNTTPGDCDAPNHGLTLPAINMAANQMSLTADFCRLSNLNITSTTSTAGGTFLAGASQGKAWLHRCRITNTAAAAAARACTIQSGYDFLSECYFSAHATATIVLYLNAATGPNVHGCYVTGGQIGIQCGNIAIVQNCVVTNAATELIYCATSGNTIVGNTLYNAGRDGIRTFSSSDADLIRNNIIASVGAAGYCISSNGGSSGAPYIMNNALWPNAGLGGMNNINENHQYGNVTLTGNPFNVAGGDFSLNNTSGAGAACRAAGVPGAFENLGTIGYMDIGAVQVEATAAAGPTNVVDPITGSIPGI